MLVKVLSPSVVCEQEKKKKATSACKQACTPVAKKDLVLVISKQHGLSHRKNPPNLPSLPPSLPPPDVRSSVGTSNVGEQEAFDLRPSTAPWPGV